MKRTMKIAAFLVLTITAYSTAFAKNPGGVKITKFETEKVINKPNQPVIFKIEFAAIENHQNNAIKEYCIQVMVESELNPPVKVAQKIVILKPEQVVQAPIYNQPFWATPEMINAKLQKLEMTWVPENKHNVFGHRALLRIMNKSNMMLAIKETFFDVADEWWQVMRPVSIGAQNVANPKNTEQGIALHIRNLRRGYYNTFLINNHAPEPYVLAPKEDEWLYQNHRGKDLKVSKPVLQSWSKDLHKNGIAFLTSNQTAMVKGQDEWKTYLEGKKEPYAKYNIKEGMFTPNSIKIAGHFADKLAGAIKMFGFDGIVMESAFSSHINTSLANDINGKKLTDLSAGEVGYIYLEQAKKDARKLKPDFAFISLNATLLCNLVLPDKTLLPNDKIFANVKEHVKKFKADNYSQLVDMWSVVNDPHSNFDEPQFPRNYERMSITLNSIIEATDKPLLSWASLIFPAYAGYSISETRPHMAALLASRVRVHDHHGPFGGVWSNGYDSPVSQQVIKYNRFMARFSWYLWDPDLKWVDDPTKDLKVESSIPLFWDRVIYQRKLANGSTQTVINILNLPENGKIIRQQKIPPIARNVDLKIGGKHDITRVTFLNPDDDNLTPITLEKDRDDGEVQTYRVPAITCWGIVIVESN